MSCPHTKTTAVLAAFGEAPEDFESHLSACSECRQVVSEHLQTLSLIEPANEASIRLATRLGASFERDYLDHGWNARIYRHLPPTRFLQEAA